jgi:hypothetical protein
MPNYEGTGGIRVGGCAGVQVEFFYQFKFGINSFAWIGYKAKKGILERVVIKDVRMPLPYVFLYTDTLNAYYNENELMTQEEAVTAFTLYKERIMNEGTKNALKC